MRSSDALVLKLIRVRFTSVLLFAPFAFRLDDVEQIIMFSDLECDYINPIDLCNKLNQVGSDPSLLPIMGELRRYRWRAELA